MAEPDTGPIVRAMVRIHGNWHEFGSAVDDIQKIFHRECFRKALRKRRRKVGYFGFWDPVYTRPPQLKDIGELKSSVIKERVEDTISPEERSTSAQKRP